MTKITDLTGAAPDSADVFPYVDVSDTTEDAAGTPKKATAQQIVDAAANIDAATLTYSGTGTVISITQDTDTNHTWWEYAPHETPTLKWRQNITAGISFPAQPDRDDVTWNWGYNQAVQGAPANNADACFYLQLENHYDPGSGPQFEYHLNWYSADGQSSLRPFQVNVNKATGATSWSWWAGTYFFLNLDSDSLVSLNDTEINLWRPTNVIGRLTARGELSVFDTDKAQLSILNTNATKVNITPNPQDATVELEFNNWGTIEFLGTAFVVNGAALDNRISDSGTDDVQTITTWRRNTSGTAAAGFGVQQLFRLEVANGGTVTAAGITVQWFDAGVGTRKGDLILAPYDTAAREALRLRADGSKALVIMSGIPTSDPAVAGALWSDGGTVKVSSG